MMKRLIRRLKMERLARKLDPTAFKRSLHYRKKLARESASSMFAAAEGQYDATGWRPGRS